MVKRGGKRSKDKLASMLIPVPPRCICGANDYLIYRDFDRLMAKCRKCDYIRVYYGSGHWTGRFDH